MSKFGQRLIKAAREAQAIARVTADPDVLERLQEKIERPQEALWQIDQWSRAYPLTVFPEPDLEKAHELLTAGGITLDAVAASAMRHVVEGVGKIARAALDHE
jgi:hypothetical protein